MASPTAEPPPIVGAPRWGDEILIVLSVFVSLGALTRAAICLGGWAFVPALAGRFVSFFSPFGHYDEVLIMASLSVGAMWALLLWRRFAPGGAAGEPPRSTSRPVTLLLLTSATAVVLGSWLVVQFQGPIARWLLAVTMMIRG